MRKYGPFVDGKKIFVSKVEAIPTVFAQVGVIAPTTSHVDDPASQKIAEVAEVANMSSINMMLKELEKKILTFEELHGLEES